MSQIAIRASLAVVTEHGVRATRVARLNAVGVTRGVTEIRAKGATG
jgi:hypothetical protein